MFDFEIIGLSNCDGYDLKIASVVGADLVKLDYKIGRAILSTSEQTKEVVILYELIPQYSALQGGNYLYMYIFLIMRLGSRVVQLLNGGITTELFWTSSPQHML